MDILNYIENLEDLYKHYANPERAQSMKAYMRNKFDYIGLDTTTRRKLLKEHIGKFGKPAPDFRNELIDTMWDKPHREFLYSALELLMADKKKLVKDDLPFIESLAVRKSWWDSIDGLSADIFGTYFRLYPEMRIRTSDYIAGDNFWMQRVAILFQLKYKEDTDTSLFEDFIPKLTDSNEFFIQKAIGWILRQYAKTNPEWVIGFVQKTPLKPLSRREALKNIK